MNKQDLDKIREIAENHRTEPRKQAWDKLDTMINRKTVNRKLLTYRNMSIAAVLVSVVSVVTVLGMYLEHRNPAIFTSNESFSPMIMEELPAGDDPVYSAKNVAMLNNAYESIGYKSILESKTLF